MLGCVVRQLPLVGSLAVGVMLGLGGTAALAQTAPMAGTGSDAGPAPVLMRAMQLPMDTPPMAPMAESDAPDEQAEPSRLYFDVGNPQAGDTIHLGGYMIEGIAFDRAADQSPGIDHIDVFLDDRDTGGMLIGHAVLGAPSPTPDDPDLVGAGWTAQVLLTSKMTGPHTLFFYVLSGVTGEEMVVTIPVRVMP